VKRGNVALDPGDLTNYCTLQSPAKTTPDGMGGYQDDAPTTVLSFWAELRPRMKDERFEYEQNQGEVDVIAKTWYLPDLQTEDLVTMQVIDEAGLVYEVLGVQNLGNENFVVEIGLRKVQYNG